MQTSMTLEPCRAGERPPCELRDEHMDEERGALREGSKELHWYCNERGIHLDAENAQNIGVNVLRETSMRAIYRSQYV